MRRQSDEPSFKDPVCGMEVSRKTAVEEYIYQGRSYYFCARTCRKAFEAAPENHIRQHRQRGKKPGQNNSL